MNLLIITPSLNSRHGGIRIIVEWANRLSKFHNVMLHSMKGEKSCDWLNISSDVTLVGSSGIRYADIVLLTSPHTVGFASMIKPSQKCFIFCQMHEALFKPDDQVWQNLCRHFYTLPYPMFAISEWNIKTFEVSYGRKVKTYYISNGVNFDDFPVKLRKKHGKVILLESPEPTNPTKDISRIALQVAAHFKTKGYKIIGYGLIHPRIFGGVMDEFYVKPDLSLMNRLYERASVMIKCTKYDARSTAPMEAMTKGCVTVRGIIQGDDDLTSDNSVRCAYDLEKVKIGASVVLDNPRILDELRDNCYYYVEQCGNWDPIIKHVNAILCDRPLRD